MVPAPLPPQPPRRVSYVIPPPTNPPPLLSLPPIDSQRPRHPQPRFKIESNSSSNSNYNNSLNDHPRHRLAVQAITLDLSTPISHDSKGEEGSESVDGLLYMGGRDGLLTSWELGLPAKRRKVKYGKERFQSEDEGGRNSRASSLFDYAREEDESDDEIGEGLLSNSVEIMDDLGTSAFSSKNGLASRRSKEYGRRTSTTSTTKLEEKPEELPTEESWQVDDERMKSMGGNVGSAKFRQCLQSHTDWINDIVLCNHNRTREC